MIRVPGGYRGPMTDTDARLHALVDRLDPAPGASGHVAHSRGLLARGMHWYLGMRDEYQTGGGQTDERPLTGYALLSTGYLVAAGTAAALVARRRRGGAALRAAWIGSVLLVALALGALWAFRHEIAAAWPPAARLVGAPPAGGG